MGHPDPLSSQPVQPGAGGGPLPNLGSYLSRGFHVYGQRWRDWLVPMLVAGAITVAAMLCCLVPNFLVAGPLACGLYACGLRTLRGQPFDAGTLWQDWTVAGRAMLAHLAITLLTALPGMLLYAAAIVGFVLLMGSMAALGPQGPAAAQPPDEAFIPVMVAFVGCMLLVALGALAVVVWTFWIGTKTIFVMPLIADRRVSFSTAWRMSWAETRNHFWELLLLYFVASLIGMVGMYVFYIGLIFTLPIYFSMIGAAYEHRFPFHAQPVDGENAPGLGRTRGPAAH